MAGCHNDTCCTAEFADSKGKLRCRAEGIEQICLDPVCIQAECCFHCKFRRKFSGIICDRYALFLAALLDDVIGKTLCCFSDRVEIHTVCSCTDHTTKAACTEFKITIEAVFDLFFIITDCQKLVFGILIKIIIL